ncbi:aspartate aminotransferase [Aspergillus niger]|nr:aspartate aminotransferase [Aspergillus niger]
MTEADPMSIFVLHASAHNPSGWDPTPEQWRKIGALMKERTLFPLFDAAYLGLTSDNYDEDAYAIRYFAEELNLQMGVCISFAKSMGMYGSVGSQVNLCFTFQYLLSLTRSLILMGERTGLCAFVSRNHSIATNVESNLAQLIRCDISNPPAFGAGIVATVLGDGGLFSQWQRDLMTMSSRITGMRKRLFGELTALGTPGDWKKLTQQKGMFCVLGLTPDRVHYVKTGLNEGNVRYVAECIHQIVCRREE